ncbi:putative cellulose synthase (UDP-forming) [Helianthus annuus]|nr:putative cellulose synthase (UDP-forming) [Helianthus annuus]
MHCTGWRSIYRMPVRPAFKAMTIIPSIDDLNYPEKTDTYYIDNAPCIFSACWKGLQ